MTAKKDKTSSAAKAAKASAEKAAAAQAAKDAAANAGPKLAAMKDGKTVTVKAADGVPPNLPELDKPQIQLGKTVNAVRIQPTGEPQTVYVAGLRDGVWCHVAKCGVPANAPGVVKIPGGALAFSKAGGGDIVLVACKL